MSEQPMIVDVGKVATTHKTHVERRDDGTYYGWCDHIKCWWRRSSKYEQDIIEAGRIHEHEKVRARGEGDKP